MDPVSALGIAAAALQFLDASIKASNVFREIRHSAESSTERNSQLEHNIRAAQALRGSLISTTTATQGTTDPVSELTARCASKADQLLVLLEYVRGAGEDISYARATVRALRKKKQIEKLHDSLAEDRRDFHHMICQKLLSSVDLLTLNQSKESSNLTSFVQKLIGDLVEQRKAHKVDNTILASKVDSVYCDMRLRFNETDRLMMREKVLESLFFPEIDQRQMEIKEPAPDTLDWLLESTSAPDTLDWPFESISDIVTIPQTWSNFGQWLREDTSTYWISGKAGSGKSTLMAHIINDSRTHDGLDVWRDRDELRVLSFFFWRAGTKLQNSILGLLRSLLYQLCRLNPIIVEGILTQLKSPLGVVPVWTERSLLDHVTKTIQSSQGFRFCIFIDGLDEYEGPYNDLVDQINQLQSFGNVKICASSRPELELANRFQGLKQLRLQDLNRRDIAKFVGQSLAKAHLNERDRIDLTAEVVQRAEGVFLWAALVTQSLLKGSMAGDDQNMLWKRLDSLPGNMYQLFERMLMDVDIVHRESLALYVQLLMAQHEFELFGSIVVAVPTIAILQLHKPIDSYEEFYAECQRTELRIATRSAGLLEVYNDDWRHTKATEKDWEQSRSKFISSKPLFMLNPAGPMRRRYTEDEPYPAMLEYDARLLKWIHRSAFDFFSNLNEINEKIPSFQMNMSRETLLQQIGESSISYLLAAPSCRDDHSLTVQRLRQLSRFVSRWHDEFPTTASALVEKIYSLYTQLDARELINTPQRTWFDQNDNECGEIAFWFGCAISENWGYVLSRLGRISKMSACIPIIAHLMAGFVDSAEYWARRRDTVQVINSLAESLLQIMVEGLKTNCLARATLFRCDCPFCVDWKCSTHDGSAFIMTGLTHILDRLSARYLDTYRVSGFSPPHPLELPASLYTLMEITNTYVGPDFGLKRISIQISARVWVDLCSSILRSKEKDAGFDEGYVATHLSAAEAPRAIKILCVPSFKGQQSAFGKFLNAASFSNRPWEPVTGLQSSQFISLHLSITALSQILSLFTYWASSPIKFRMIPKAQKQREEACELLLQVIKSAEQGLDAGQQLIAAACVRAGFLDPTIM